MGRELLPVSIITRAHNRLEYTIRCINAVRTHTIYPKYEHIIVSQGSTDGTVEWLNWIKKDMPNPAYYSKVKVLHPGKNLGSLGGTLYALDSVNNNLIVVLDNDIEVPVGWLLKMEHLWDWLQSHKGTIALMARRIGVTKTKKCSFFAHINYSKSILSVWTTSNPAACFISKKEFILDNRDKMKQHVDIGNHGRTFKTFDVEVIHMEGAHLHGDGSYLQNCKYKPAGVKA